jgi:hypothetical protein
MAAGGRLVMITVQPSSKSLSWALGPVWGFIMYVLPRSLALSLTRDDAGGAESPTPWLVDEDYWLGHCEGFRVDGPHGRLGVVEHVVYRSRVDRPDVVAVRAGSWKPRMARVSVKDVIEVCPAQERLVVRADSRPAERATMWGRTQRALHIHARWYEGGRRDPANRCETGSGRRDG